MTPATEALVERLEAHVSTVERNDTAFLMTEAAAALRALSKQIAENANCSPTPAGEE